MNLKFSLYLKITLLFSFIFVSISCNKDEDLFAELNYLNENNTINQDNAADNSQESSPQSSNGNKGSSGLKAFPSAEGYGKFATGGRGGVVYKVTNLNEGGPGSFREAVSLEGPRTVLFNVSGTIELTSPIYINNPDITIAGQTAPGDGIALTLEGVDLPVLQVQTSNVIIRHLRIRHSTQYVGATSGSDGISVSSGSDIIIDHCSITWASDENVAITEYTENPTSDITIQNCIIGQGYTGSSKGMLITGDLDRISIYRNYFVENQYRSPRISSDYNYPNGDRYLEVINNVIYRYNVGSAVVNHQGSGRYMVNFVNNLYENENGGPTLRRSIATWYTMGLPQEGTTALYVEGNLDYFRDSNNLDNWESTGGAPEVENNNVLADQDLRVPSVFNTQIIVDNLALPEASNVWNTMYQDVGASLPVRDAVDQNLIDLFINQTSNFGGYNTQTLPYLASTSTMADTDNDGIPDAAENIIGSDPFIVDNNQDFDGDGYTNLEEYLNIAE